MLLPQALAPFIRNQDTHLKHLVQGQVAIGTGVNGPKGNLAIGRCLSNKHVMEREVVANGILKEKDNS